MTDVVRRITWIRPRRILDSHVAVTLEFEVCLDDRWIGRGSAPRGETRSIYEDRVEGIPPEVVATIDGLVGRSVTQVELDATLRDARPLIGGRLSLALSVAFLEAAGQPRDPAAASPGGAIARLPGIAYNLLNGGLHAYTNPIRADFTELLLVPRQVDVWDATAAFLDVHDETRRRLASLPRTEVGGNVVHDLGPDGDLAALELVGEVLRATGHQDAFEVMVDGSAGDWWADGAYRLPVAGRLLDPAQLIERWRALAAAGIGYIEDPFAEADLASWRTAHDAGLGAALLGDNFTSSRRDLLEDGRAAMIDGIVIKPDQSGTVTDAFEVARAATTAGLMIVASHRSIETESPFLIRFAVYARARFIKVGPLRDYSAVVKLNELLRLAGAR